MSVKLFPTDLPGTLLLEPPIHRDARGRFVEVFHALKYESVGISDAFVQDNFSYSVKGVFRGLHFQKNKPQAKLVTVLRGEIYDIAVDIRRDSPNFGKWTGVHLSGENLRQFYIPEYFAHGFCVLSEEAEVLYKCSDFYDPEDEGGILWSDPDLSIRLPLEDVILSPKDAGLPRLRDLLG